MFETISSPVGKDQNVEPAQAGEKAGWNHRWNEAKIELFQEDFKKTLEHAGFIVQRWQEGDPKGFANGKPQEIATQAYGHDKEVVVTYDARRPNDSNVQFYSRSNGELTAEGGNHDMTASEFLDNLRYCLNQHGIPISNQFNYFEEVERIKNWTRYD